METRQKRRRMQPQNTDTRIDFLQCIEIDVSLHIMSFLDDPADIIRASAVSPFWRRFVIANSLAKRSCLKRIPGVTDIVGTAIMYKSQSRRKIDYVKVESKKEKEWEIFERDQKVYASLLLAITKSTVSLHKSHHPYIRDGWFCMEDVISASSTDNYPDECILNTLHPDDTFFNESDIASYWSSKGQNNPDVPETLIYKLKTGWVVTEIDIQPFKAFFLLGKPIYSAKYVRFRVGRPKSQWEFEQYERNLPFEEPVDDKFVWTYVSPEFPMAQENCLQSFKLPEPILCIGAYLQIELLGRVQRHEKDGLFYICLSYVQVLGRPLYPAFDFDIEMMYPAFDFDIEMMTGPDRKLFLKYCPKKLKYVLKKYPPINKTRLISLQEEDDQWYDRMGEVEFNLQLLQRRQMQRKSKLLRKM